MQLKAQRLAEICLKIPQDVDVYFAPTFQISVPKMNSDKKISIQVLRLELLEVGLAGSLYFHGLLLSYLILLISGVY